jgi:hypothetical protein
MSATSHVLAWFSVYSLTYSHIGDRDHFGRGILFLRKSRSHKVENRASKVAHALGKRNIDESESLKSMRARSRHSVQSLWGNYLSSGKVPLGQKSAPHTVFKAYGVIT